MDVGFFGQQAGGAGKKERTQAALLDAAVMVIASKGMEAARISEMTEVAGLANGTFYNHFESKDHILRTVAVRIAVEVSRQLDADMAELTDAPRRVVTATTKFVLLMLEAPDWAAVLMDGADHIPSMSEDMFQFLRSDLEMGVRQGAFDAQIDRFTVEQVIALIAAAIRTQLVAGVHIELTRRLCENVLRILGVSSSKATRIVGATFKQMGLLEG